MGRPVLFSENFFNDVLFPSHTIGANEEATDHEAVLVGCGRRDTGNYWTPTTVNQQAYIGADLNRVRYANCIFIDRVNNLQGIGIDLRASNDSFSTYSTVLDLTVPTQVFHGSRLAQTPGVLTEEGAWGLLFDAHAAKHWRLYVDAMGAGLKPQIGGIYLGLAFQPQYSLVLPYADEDVEARFRETVSDTLWVGVDRPAQRRLGPVHLKLLPDEYGPARYTISSLFMRRKPMWLVHDDEQAERAVLAVTPSGQRTGLRRERDWGYKQIQFEWVEHEPKLTS